MYIWGESGVVRNTLAKWEKFFGVRNTWQNHVYPVWDLPPYAHI